MKQSFAKIKEALCEKFALYIQNDMGEYGIHPDALSFCAGGVLEQQLSDGSWAHCAFYSKIFEGQIWYDSEGEALGFTRQRGWSVQEKETYALVSCLLKFKTRISGGKVTVFRNLKSLGSWY